ncbi:unnamed protein product [Meloidogyne enterolobii]|uniref:Uncharacterized protein n=1 Tax=Meloidogyne enterolobii TaxID=390850 RepID=A0ACB1APM7_MELEN
MDKKRLYSNGQFSNGLFQFFGKFLIFYLIQIQSSLLIIKLLDQYPCSSISSNKAIPSNMSEQHKLLTPTVSSASSSSISVVPATPSPSPSHKSAEVRKNVSTESSSKQNKFQRKRKLQSSSSTSQSPIPLTVSSNLNSSLPTSKQTLPSTSEKGEQRKAHLSIPSKAEQQKLVPLDPNNRKVALQLRQTRLKRIHAEYVKICVNDPKMAIESAQHEEKLVIDLCVNKMAYTSAIPNVIDRLRDFILDSADPKRNQGHRYNSAYGLQLVAQNFYNGLEVYILSDDQLWENGYPRWTTLTQEIDDDFDSSDERPRNIVEIRQSELDSSKGHSKLFISDDDLKRVCSRCGIEYQLTPNGAYVSSEECIYHWGRALKEKSVVEARYTCCQSTLGVRGCIVAGMHVTQTLRLSTLEQYVSTPKPCGVEDPRSTKVYAMDCEMVYSNWGPEVARVSVVGRLEELVMDVFIRPENTLIDCNTRFSGLDGYQILTAECTLDKARERLFELINSETILIGHSLERVLRALRLVHTRVVDTSVVFPHPNGLPQKRALKTLASEILQIIIQEEEGGHDSKEDALTCMRIMLRKVRAVEG